MNTHEYQGSLLNCLKCFRRKDDPIHFVEEKIITLFSPDNKPAAKLCAGHTCPSCKRSWNHDYFCGHDRQGLCLDCAQQTAAEINRPKHLEDIKANGEVSSKHMTALEAKTLMTQHEEFVVLNIIKDPITGQNNPDWQQKLSEHIQQIEKIIEQQKLKLSATRKALAAKEVQEMNNLTDEEREEFLRAARRMRTPKEKKVKVQTSGTGKDKLIGSLLKQYGKSDTPDNRQWLSKLMGVDL